MINIYQPALERSITGAIISMIRFMSEREPIDFIATNIYRLTKELREDFCKILEEDEIDDSFRKSILRQNFNRDKYNIERIFNIVIEGEDVVSKINKLVGNIRERSGTTILGKFGFFYSEEICEFPVSCPSSAASAEKQISLFWDKYRNLGGIAKDAINYSSKDIEETVVVIKPNAFYRPYDPRVGDVIDILSRTGMFIIASKIYIPTRERMEEFYKPHKGKPFFSDLIDFMSNKKSLCLLYQGANAIKEIRNTAMTIVRDNYSENILENTIHTSETEEDAIREKNAINFSENLLLD